MRIIFCGSGEVAVPSLTALHGAGHDIPAVYTQPPRKAGRGGKLRATPVAERAAALGLRVVEVENINREGHPEAMAALGAQMVAVVDFGQILGRKVRESAPLGTVCMHVSLLPELRGAAPINWAILRGMARTGVTTFQVVREVDAGAIFLQEALDIGPDETADELRDRLAALGGPLLARTVQGLADGTLKAREQDHSAATMAPKLEKADGRLDFTAGAAALVNRIRGTWSWPGAAADFVHAGGKPVRVILARAQAHVGGATAGEPGTLAPNLHIITQDGSVEILELKVAGKNLMRWRDFVNGYRAAAGDRFVSAAEQEAESASVNLERIGEIARQEMEARREKQQLAREPGWLYFHGLRTAAIAAELVRDMKAAMDGDVLFVGALFHDIGKGATPHNEKGARLTRKLLGDYCTPEQLAQVCQIVEQHNQRGKSAGQPMAVRVVQDADLLDHVGPVGAWLAFYWSGAHGETVADHTRFITGQENRKYREGMRSQLNFDLSHQMMDERIQWEDTFFSNFRKVYVEGIWHPRD